MHIRLILLLPGLLLITGMRMILPWRYLSILISGLMVAERIFPPLGASKLLVLGVYLPAAEVAFDHLV